MENFIPSALMWPINTNFVKNVKKKQKNNAHNK